MYLYISYEQNIRNENTVNGVARFYGEGFKELKYVAQIEVVGGWKKSKDTLMTASCRTYTTTVTI